MKILTPSGYKFPVELANGDEVCAFNSGAPILNRVENIDPVDYKEWCRWWKHHDILPSFNWYRINGEEDLLFGEQSIWRNGSNVCHVKDIAVGDRIYDDADRLIKVTSIDVIEDKSLVWYRFDIDGDHSYIVDRRTVHNASRFLITGGGSVSWTAINTAIWAASSGGATGQTVPGSADTVTMDGSSGGGTITLNFGGTITIQSLTMGAYTGTFDNSVNNNNIVATVNATAFQWAGTGIRNYKLGTATYTLSGTNAIFDLSNGTNLTFSGNTGSTISFTGTGGSRFTGSGQTFGTVSFGATSGSATRSVTQSSTYTNITITAPCWIEFQAGETQTVTGAVSWVGSAGAPIALLTSSNNATSTLALAGGSSMQWCTFRCLIVTGSPTTTNCLDLRNNSGSGFSINAPSAGGGGAGFSATIF